MTDVPQVVGVFRDASQARMAVVEALKHGLEVAAPDHLTEDAAGVHVALSTTGNAETARRLLLEFGAYRASISGQELAG